MLKNVFQRATLKKWVGRGDEVNNYMHAPKIIIIHTEPGFSVVSSDMAPNATGVQQMDHQRIMVNLYSTSCDSKYW